MRSGSSMTESKVSLLKVREQVIHFVEVTESEPGFRLDIRYARKDNFLGRKVYSMASFYLLESVAADLRRVRDALKPHGFGLLLFDGYRPWAVSKLFWDSSSEENRAFLADPADGSSHNRGCAVDLSLFHLSSGAPAAMPSDFDEMNEKAASDYAGGDERARENRDLLRRVMEAHGFSGISNEWWHYNHESRRLWPVMNFSFEEIAQAPQIRRPPQAR
jgi:D-alanyl-D-alanine dipeptidase